MPIRLGLMVGFCVSILYNGSIRSEFQLMRGLLDRDHRVTTGRQSAVRMGNPQFLSCTQKLLV
jgi:hypothetical protein